MEGKSAFKTTIKTREGKRRRKGKLTVLKRIALRTRDPPTTSARTVKRCPLKHVADG
jgi:hypothetical protein